MEFKEKLKQYGIEPSAYLSIARRRAKALGYNLPVNFTNDDVHKLEYDGIKFGAKNNKDYIIYLLTEGQDKADKMRKAYLSRMLAKTNDRTITKKMRLTRINW